MTLGVRRDPPLAAGTGVRGSRPETGGRAQDEGNVTRNCRGAGTPPQLADPGVSPRERRDGSLFNYYGTRRGPGTTEVEGSRVSNSSFGSYLQPGVARRFLEVELEFR